MNEAPVPNAYQALIDSARVSSGTRRALRAREAADDPAYRPVAMTPAQLIVLRAMMQRILPQPDGTRIDLAARLDAQLGEARGDGWRFEMLPEDREAYASGLSLLDDLAGAEHGVGFADLSGEQQDAMLTRAAAGTLHGRVPAHFDGAQMKLWFEDVRADAVKLYMAHPATLATIGYSGIAYGGDGADKPGFTLIGIGERENWEPAARVREPRR